MVVEPKIAPQEGVSKGPVKSRPSDVSPVEVVVVNAEGDFRRGDWLATEEPLEIRVRGAGQEAVSVAVTMRTPGHDAELAVGFLHSEGFLGEPGEVESVGPCLTGAKGRSCNIVSVALAKPFDGASLKRNFVSNSSCGLCGKVALDQIAVRCSRVGPGPIVPKSVIIGLPGTLRDAQAARRPLHAGPRIRFRRLHPRRRRRTLSACPSTPPPDRPTHFLWALSRARRPHHAGVVGARVPSPKPKPTHARFCWGHTGQGS